MGVHPLLEGANAGRTATAFDPLHRVNCVLPPSLIFSTRQCDVLIRSVASVCVTVSNALTFERLDVES